jgi:hypothetical protein
MPRSAQAVIAEIGGLIEGERIRVTQGGFFRNNQTGNIEYRSPCENCHEIMALNASLEFLPLPPGIPEGMDAGAACEYVPPEWW